MILTGLGPWFCPRSSRSRANLTRPLKESTVLGTKPVRMYLCLSHVSLYCRYIVAQLIDSSVANSSKKKSAPVLKYIYIYGQQIIVFKYILWLKI